jgi:hypothetical protein
MVSRQLVFCTNHSPHFSNQQRVHAHAPDVQDVEGLAPVALSSG